MAKNRRNQKNAPKTVEQNFTEEVEVAVAVDQIAPAVDPETIEPEEEDQLPFGPDEQPRLTPQPTQTEPEPEEVEDKGYRVIRTDKISNLAVGEKYKREDKKNCKIWTVVLKEEGKTLVSSSPKNTHNPRKEYDLEVVVIELT